MLGALRTIFCNGKQPLNRNGVRHKGKEAMIQRSLAGVQGGQVCGRTRRQARESKVKGSPSMGRTGFRVA